MRKGIASIYSKQGFIGIYLTPCDTTPLFHNQLFSAP
jgi:hypothetical protein